MKLVYELVIQERPVLLRIKHLQEGARRVSVVATADLVDFVNQNERVLGSDLLQSLDGFTRHSTAFLGDQLGRRLRSNPPIKKATNPI